MDATVGSVDASPHDFIPIAPEVADAGTPMAVEAADAIPTIGLESLAGVYKLYPHLRSEPPHVALEAASKAADTTAARLDGVLKEFGCKCLGGGCHFQHSIVVIKKLRDIHVPRMMMFREGIKEHHQRPTAFGVEFFMSELPTLVHQLVETPLVNAGIAECLNKMLDAYMNENHAEYVRLLDIRPVADLRPLNA